METERVPFLGPTLSGGHRLAKHFVVSSLEIRRLMFRQRYIFSALPFSIEPVQFFAGNFRQPTRGIRIIKAEGLSSFLLLASTFGGYRSLRLCLLIL